MKTITILQPRGLGDIIFSQKIAIKLIEENFQVFWPQTTYFWIKDYIKINNLHFVDYFNMKSDFILHLQNSIEENHPYDIMTCKYKTIGKTLPQLPEHLHDISFNDWSDYFHLERNIEKENHLFYDILGLKDSDEYILYNSKFGVGQENPNVNSGVENIKIKKINLDFINNFTLFDWCKVIENAKEIHTVDTSLIYLVEKINTKDCELFMYPRHNEHTEKCLKNILNKKWNWV